MRMIASEYNNFISIADDKTLCYNAFSRRFLIFKSNIAEKIIHALASNELESIEPSMVQKLVEFGYLISEDINQLKILKEEVERIDFDSSFYELTVNPTLDCNFRCWYCYENHHQGSEMKEDIVLRVKRHLQRHLNPPVNRFLLKFFGGEPLLKFKTVCRPIIQSSTDLCRKRCISCSIHITSNTYLLTEEMVDFLKKFPVSFQTTLDGSRLFHDKVRFEKPGVGSYHRILSNVFSLVNNGIFVTLRVNYTLGNLKSIEEIINDLEKANMLYPNLLNVNFQRVWQDIHKGNEDWVAELLAKYRSRLLDLGISSSLPDLNNPRAFSCYADKENFACINYNADFYKCTARDFTPENRLGVLDEDGNLKWDEGKYEPWRHARFSNPNCHHCRVAPICLGGCRQKAMETARREGCPLGYDEDRKDNLILQRFESQYMLGSKSGLI